jgi:Uma2 family endonuclease
MGAEMTALDRADYKRPKSQKRTSERARVILRPHIGPASAGIALTPEEFDALRWEDCDDRYRYELINGVLVVSPLVADAEADPNDELGHLLRTYGESKNGHHLDKTLPERDVRGEKNRRRCDRAIWAGLGRLPDTRKDIPTIVVEFVSESKRDAIRDYEHKRDEYLEAGVVEYWVIDRFQRTMTVFTRGSFGPSQQIINERQTYRTPLLPAFELPLTKLLAQADNWPLKRPRKRKQGDK